LKGRGWFVSDHCPKTQIQAGDVVILFPNEWHNYAPDKDSGWEEAWIGFSGDFVQRIIKENFFDISYPIVNVGIRITLYDAIKNACKIAQDERPAYQQQLAGYIFLVVSSIYAYSKQAPFIDSPDSECINTAQKFMREHTSKNLRMEDVAKHAGMGYSKFRKLFRDYTGFSPQQYFLNLKLEESKDLLLNTSLSSKEIAYRLGFDTATYFNRIFRQHYKQTPIEFRNSVHKEYNV
jgi:AraC-like DNA-binding protein